MFNPDLTTKDLTLLRHLCLLRSFGPNAPPTGFLFGAILWTGPFPPHFQNVAAASFLLRPNDLEDFKSYSEAIILVSIS